jgi:Family of unknown function (DUF6502)
MGLDSRRVGLLKTLEAVFEPLARLLVEHGISSPEAECLLRAVCVREVAKAGVIPGKRPNASRVALVTGVDRGVVRRILKTGHKAGEVRNRRHRVNRVLAGWHSDAAYSSGGRPLLLPIKTTKARDYKRTNFWALARRYAPGVYPGLILSELLRVGAVEELENGRLRVRAREYRAAEFSRESVSELGARVRDLMQTILNNATESGWPRICRNVETTDIDPKFLPLIRKLFADRSESMLSGVREELTSSRWNQTDPVGPGVRIGVTVFTHEEWPQEYTSNGKRIDTSSQRARAPRRRASRRHAN